MPPDNLTAEEVISLTGGTFDGSAIRDARLATESVTIFESRWGGWRVAPQTSTYSRRTLQAHLDVLLGQPERFQAANDNGPVDVWERSAYPRIPPDTLPCEVGDFAAIMSDTMGADPAGLGMAALTVCAAAIPDRIVIQPKQHDPSWTESARIWTALVGLPSTMKSPIVAAASRPLKRLDDELHREFQAAQAAYEAIPKEARKDQPAPKHKRLRLEDTTMEAAQEVLKDSPDGLLLLQDELSGWFGSMDKYSGGGRGAQKDRGFWLQAFNGGSYTVNRVGRGSSMIPNLSVSLLGGIQPELIRAIVRDTHDDGLLQRLFPIVLRPGRLGQDVPQPDVAADFSGLVGKLAAMPKPVNTFGQEVPVRFSPGAQLIWQDVTERNHQLARSWEAVNVKLAAHVGKYNGMFARLCLLFHCIETVGSRSATIEERVAVHARAFLYDFLYPHAQAFYSDVVGLSDRQDRVLAVAGWILTHRPETVTVRAVRRGDSIMRAMENPQAEEVLHQLDAFGWLNPVQRVIRRDSAEWSVEPSVYELFADRAEEEAERRVAIREIIAGSQKLQAA